MLLEPRLADLFRRICSHQNAEADNLFEAMLVLYIQQKTDLEMVFEPDVEAYKDDIKGATDTATGLPMSVFLASQPPKKADRRQGQRRTKTGTSALYPTTSGQPEKRGTKDRRKKK